MRGLLRLLTLAALLAFGIGIADPVEVMFVVDGGSGSAARAMRRLDAREAKDPAAVARAVLSGAAVAGPRAVDLELQAPQPAADWPPGPLGAQAVSPIPPLLADPEAFSARALRPPAVGRPTALELRFDGAGVVAVEVVLRDSMGEALRRQVRLRGDEPLVLEWTPLRGGSHDFELHAMFDTGELVREAAFLVADPPRVLVFEPSGVVAEALSTQGVPVDRVPEVALDVTRHAAVVVGAALVPAMQEQLAAAIDAGLGAFVLAPGFGRPGEALHDLLPLLPEPATDGEGDGGGGPAVVDPTPTVSPPPSDEPPPSGAIEDPGQVSETPVEIDKRSIALVLVVDRSGSMGTVVSATGRTRMSYAKTSALESARALATGDQVGIVTFGNKGLGRVELPLTDAADRAAVAAGVAKVAHGPEYTYLLSGLRHADRLLQAATAAVKHVVVVTDGEFNTSEAMAMRALAHQMFQERGTSVTILSIVSGKLSSGFRRYAEEITLDGGGTFYSLPAAESVPVFVSAEVRRSLERAGRSTGDGPGESEAPREPESQPDPKPEPEPQPEPQPEPESPPARLAVRAVASSPVLAPDPVGAWPTLASAVPTTAPLDAQVLLVAGDDGWPLLCYANRGLGRIGAFAADLAGPAAGEWHRDSTFPARLALWVQHVMRAEPRGEPQSLALVTKATPAAPTPAAIAAFARLAGTQPMASSQPAEPAVVRAVRSRVPEWAFVALGLVVALAFFERLAVLRGKHVA